MVPRAFSCRTSPLEGSQLPKHLPDVTNSKCLCYAHPPVASPLTPTHAQRQGYLRAATLRPGHRGGARMRSSVPSLPGCSFCCRLHPSRQDRSYPNHFFTLCKKRVVKQRFHPERDPSLEPGCQGCSSGSVRFQGLTSLCTPFSFCPVAMLVTGSTFRVCHRIKLIHEEYLH